MISHLDDLIALAVAHGFGVYGVNIFKGSAAIIPEGEGPFISFIGSGGAGESGTHNLSPFEVAYERPSTQVVCRAVDPEIAEATAIALYPRMRFQNTFINGTWWVLCKPVQEPFDHQRDGKGLARWAFNLECEKRTSPATS